MINRELSEQEIVRRQALDQLRALNLEPYPAEAFETNATSEEILKHFDPEKPNYQDVVIAGRIMSRRIMGKASFAELQDSHGRIQLYLKRDDICPGEDKILYNQVFKKLLDIGDIIGAKGYVFVTQMGETTLHVTSFKILSKAIRPLPIVKEKDGKTYDAFTNPEQRYRQRYLDLLLNEQSKERFVKRTRIIQSMRDYLNKQGYLEVETPVLQPIYGGAAAKPFKTKHNALDQTLYLRIANELYLKRLIVGGFDGVFEFAKDFRNEGMGRFHNPEFTQMELYVAYKDYEWMMRLVEEMIEHIVKEVHNTTKIQIGENEVDFKRPWKRFTMLEAIEHFTGVDISGMDEEALRAQAKSMHVEVDSSMGKGKLIDEIFGEKCEPNLIQPTFITDYPIEMSPLAKKHRHKEGFVERFELIVNGKEISNAYSELNDPVDQRERFEEQLLLAKRGDDEAMMLDEDFLRAIEHGMPPTAGLGVGIDRLTILLTNAPSIQDVIFFPQMRQETAEIPDHPKEFEKAGVPQEWIPYLQKLGFATVNSLTEEEAGKLHQVMLEINKKHKLGLQVPPIEEVKKWVGETEA